MTTNLKYIFCIFTILNSFILTSCSLNENPADQIDEERVYTSSKAIYQHAVAALYGYVGGNADGQGLQGTSRGVYDLQTFGSDEAIMPTRGVDWYDSGMWQDLYFHSWNADHEIVKNAWLYLYKVIALCNRSLEIIDRHRDLLSMMEYNQYTAEVRALRAIYYWYLLDLFGNVPIVTSTEVSMNNVKQSTRPEVFTFIENELKDVVHYLPTDRSNEKGILYGRTTVPVITFVLAKMYLNAEVYEAGEHWNDVISTCDIIRQLGYRLSANYSDNFLVNNENSVENIWTIPMDRTLYGNYQHNMARSMHWRHADAIGYVGENGSSATLTVLRVNHFEEEDEDKRFSENYWGNFAYDQNSLRVRDRNGDLLQYAPWEVRYDMKGSPYLETAGARMRKYQVDWDANRNGDLINNDIVLFRYADVLLMMAEAKVRMGQDGQTELDLVRERAGMPSIDATLDNIYDERLRELAWEGWRRNDMIRFGRYKSEATPNMRVDESDGHTALFPIPSYAMDTNPNLVQNPGY